MTCQEVEERLTSQYCVCGLTNKKQKFNANTFDVWAQQCVLCIGVEQRMNETKNVIYWMKLNTMNRVLEGDKRRQTNLEH